nr:hypothetical protein [Tanacetum cinerariifolium]
MDCNKRCFQQRAKLDIMSQMSKSTIPGNSGRLVAGDRFPGGHVAQETSNGKARMGYLPGRQRRAYIVSVKQLSATVEGFPRRHVAFP